MSGFPSEVRAGREGARRHGGVLEFGELETCIDPIGFWKRWHEAWEEISDGRPLMEPLG